MVVADVVELNPVIGVVVDKVTWLDGETITDMFVSFITAVDVILGNVELIKD